MPKYPYNPNYDPEDSDFIEDNQPNKECLTCGGEYPNGCVCYVKNKMPVWGNVED